MTKFVKFFRLKRYNMYFSFCFRFYQSYSCRIFVRKQDCTLWQSFGFSVGLWGFANVCNVGGVSFFFFLRGEEKNKINFHQICTVLSKS